jgi:hypothetical protein
MSRSESTEPATRAGRKGGSSSSGLALASALVLAALVPGLLAAHATGENYVWLNVETSHLEGRFEIRLADLESRFQIELPPNMTARREGIAASAPRVQSYLRENFGISVGGRDVPYEFTGTDVVESGELGAFAQYFYLTSATEIPDRVQVRNSVLLDGDRFHRSLLCIEYDRRSGQDYGGEFTALVFSGSNTEQVLDLTDIRGLLRVRDFVWQGMLHIWIGIDHVLFLIVLLLTAVLVWTPENTWQPMSSFRQALWNVVKIVTIFTVAHSITLSLAALDFIRLPGRLVESAIALSIVLIALFNLFPKLRHAGWAVIFVFGLFHGMGFASVMGDLPFRMGNLVKVVLAFNIGVEIGQVAIVLAAFPILFLLRESRAYRPVVLVGGSIAICAVATYWFLVRALEVAW